MRLLKIQPHPVLSEFIDFYWVMQNAAAFNKPATLVPAISPEIIFNLSDSDIFWGTGEKLNKSPYEEIVGAFNAPIQVITSQKFYLLGIRFFPHALHSLFKLNMQTVTNHIIDAASILGSNIRQLRQQLLSVHSLEERIELLNRYFLVLVNSIVHNGDSYFSFFNWVNNNERLTDVAQIADKLGFSYRYLQKLFQKHIGISPQQYLQIRRLHHAISMMHASCQSLTSIAFDCGYADQSHFIRTFKTYTHQTPLQFVKTNNMVNLLAD